MDGDGEITTEELKLAMNKLLGENMSPKEIDAVVKEVDDNGDGTVDFEGANNIQHKKYHFEKKKVLLLDHFCFLFFAEFVKMMSSC